MPAGFYGDDVFFRTGLERIVPTLNEREAELRFMYFRLGVKLVKECVLVEDLDTGQGGWAVDFKVNLPLLETRSPLNRFFNGEFNASIQSNAHLDPGQHGSSDVFVYRNRFSVLRGIMLYNADGYKPRNLDDLYFPTEPSENLRVVQKRVSFGLNGGNSDGICADPAEHERQGFRQLHIAKR